MYETKPLRSGCPLCVGRKNHEVVGRGVDIPRQYAMCVIISVMHQRIVPPRRVVAVRVCCSAELTVIAPARIVGQHLPRCSRGNLPAGVVRRHRAGDGEDLAEGGST